MPNSTKAGLRVLVCGGRDYEDWNSVRKALDALRGDEESIALIIHGDCPTGADHLADTWARMRGVPCARMAAHWNVLGRKAGPRRNQWMLDLLKPDLVLGFPGGAGTADMVRRARASGIQVNEGGERG